MNRFLRVAKVIGALCAIALFVLLLVTTSISRSGGGVSVEDTVRALQDRPTREAEAGFAYNEWLNQFQGTHPELYRAYRAENLRRMDAAVKERPQNPQDFDRIHREAWEAVTGQKGTG